MDRERKRNVGNRYLVLILCIAFVFGCKDDKEPVVEDIVEVIEEPEEVLEFGFKVDDYVIKRDTIRRGDSFGEILERNKVGYPKIFNIAEKAKDTFDIRRLQVGKPYTLLCSKDSLETPKCFIYQPTLEEYVVINFHDSIHAYTSRKPIKYVEKTATGIINSNISQTLEDQGLSPRLAYKMADEIYAWTIDFRRLQKGDRFKVIYTDKFIDDTIYTGVHNIKAAYFEHNKEPFYAFEFVTDSTKGIVDYFSEEAKNLRRAFLKAPVKFSRISSRYNLKRRIAVYGFKLRPHKGTDFAAPIGTPIMATANGTVIESKKRGGNGNYVKIRHNATYETQYLHMKKRKSKVGDFVKQGDVIGWVGMTGNTGGPHVCYRFWKNGKQVDPFKQKLPEAKPISDSLKVEYLDFISPIKQQLDNIHFLEDIFEEQNQPEQTIKQNTNQISLNR
ncbi:peptidoglycan DD-metalloendopeptidase family protein [Algibacter amylolyticus]|uniref:Peptidoglycan DD-metalloendopeptidase family protein n=1 Tax=Algibacter amylolyticus TaxID=1608400 RepID=A0A5M7AW58_9FLAO|nr:peptidoglycan DD-metalloendopeptidase family protein [Algibacter amylolyticus]KAA5820890.1 peptidoglycan DD-metalloendopeptidase family protein [Algibacter amylolyticus]MBB5269866.1 murein DD-endopeptidase MepM/ murein hydrolase activator NlpD [Algibacter amylolyticus]TSJ71965.1 peptidoglycan DD-metalloendopeptidase family protein [Algibacter amylolyticus]